MAKHARLSASGSKRPPLKDIDVGRLRELFTYHEDGFFIRLKKPGLRGNGKIGEEVRGTLNKDGYLVTCVDRVQYLFHRLVFAWHHGYCPPLVDHEDRDRLNCRIDNLRPLSPSENVLNSGLPRDNKTGFKGVFQDERGLYYARPMRNGIRCRLGYTKTAKEASELING